MSTVASLAEAWIETLNANALSVAHPVGYLAEAWIETFPLFREPTGTLVASLAEAWIEIISGDTTDLTSKVTSFAEAWIEIGSWPFFRDRSRSPPSRRRGLKRFCFDYYIKKQSRLPHGVVNHKIHTPIAIFRYFVYT